MSISIITATLNADKYIQECIESVRSQVDVHLEHIIVDGGSTDKTIEICTDSSCKLFHLPGSSIYEAMNYGIAQAECEVLGFLNADDQFACNTTLLRVSEEFKLLEGDGIVYGNCIFTVSDDAFVYRLKPSNVLHPSIAMLRLFNISHPSWFVSANTIKSLGCYDTKLRYLSDCEFVIRALANSVRFRYIDIDLAKFRLRQESASRSIDAQREKLLLFRKLNGSSFYAIFVHWLLLSSLLLKDIGYIRYRIYRLSIAFSNGNHK
jgi:glycosyltransferase involved in cell wall biosynthesis